MLVLVDEAGPSNIVGQLIIIVVLILVNAFFAASELSILSANPIKIGLLADEGNKNAKIIQKLQENETKFLSTIQVGITLAGFFSSATAAVSLSEGFAETLSKIGVPAASTIALVIVTLILSYFTLVFGELFPKRLALRAPEKIALAFAKPVNAIRIIFKPVVWLLSGSCELLVRLFHLKPKSDDKVTEDEIKALVSTGVEDGTINSDEQELINAVFTFGDLKVRDVMTPRVNIFMINIDDSISKIKKMIKEEKYSRIPVYEDSKDNVIGILNIKDIFLSLKANYTNDDLKSILRKPLFVVENMKADTLFKKMQDTLNQVAVVIDETGSVSGYLTMEDLVEEVMGNIFDEYDEIEDVITQVDENNYIIDATIPIQDLNRELDLEIEKEEDSYSSLAGFITYKLESFPQLNDEVILEDEKLTLKVIEIENTLIKKVLLKINK